ncbi:hypothetical protein [Streptomyces poriferorum]|uniref:Uncharacterized protein n=1 Tax=Streptomyces poriferorum TaxID=2798799 RepID=A0ABY9J2N7_9ACTN|nr:MULTISPECIES: hypothetical protein [unclassified Streptomyces]MDP5310429.1 hypothetical protein [Streptomyces sp. Alt4]WLQ60417.1 hypothetical protein P8A19_35560 [Streptomyces sp. Alt2]
MIAPALALEEERRAESLAVRVEEIASTPLANSLWLYKATARAAFETAAAYTEQPDWEW